MHGNPIFSFVLVVYTPVYYHTRYYQSVPLVQQWFWGVHVRVPVYKIHTCVCISTSLGSRCNRDFSAALGEEDELPTTGID